MHNKKAIERRRGFRVLAALVRNSFDAPGGSPEHPRYRDGIDRAPLPPGYLVSEAVVVAVMHHLMKLRRRSLSNIEDSGTF
jgi:hypothetical protein